MKSKNDTKKKSERPKGKIKVAGKDKAPGKTKVKGKDKAQAKDKSKAQGKVKVKGKDKAKAKGRPVWVYPFTELDAAERRAGSWDAVRGLLGGKGAGLAEMTRLGLNVPPGFIITTEACLAYLANEGRMPEGAWDQVLAAVRQIEKATGKRLGDPAAPLLVSCRSGAKFSMPGMMDTVLNIGLNDEVVQRMAERGEGRFAYDAYRRLLQMFGTVVMNIADEPFEAVLAQHRQRRGVSSDAELGAEDLAAITAEFRALVSRHAGMALPADPLEQLRMAAEAVFRSWNGKRAVDYRNAAGIAHDLGTAVNIVVMVFGNRGEDSGTGVATTRNVSTGEDELEGDYLRNAQGEDVVAGTRQTKPIAALAEEMPVVFKEFQKVARRLERHYRDVQDIEFTIEAGRLYILQTRAAKRTAQAAIRIAVSLVEERLISREEAVRRIKPADVDFFLHPQFLPEEKAAAQGRGDRLGTGLNVSPGAAVGRLALDADLAERWAKTDKQAVIMARPETKPDDVHGILAAQGVITARGGRTSHAALVARQFGKPAVVGVADLHIDLERREVRLGGRTLREGDPVAIDGTTGEVYAGQLKTFVPEVSDPYLLKLLSYADRIRRLEVWTNADYARDARRARDYGAQGIGLCRTEHMFFETERLPWVQGMILAQSEAERAEALAHLLPFQREDFVSLFQVMDGLPVTIRLIDPPLHEFLPSHDDLLREVTELTTRLSMPGADPALSQRLLQRQRLLQAVESLREANPMLGLRGVRLGIHLPALVRMQVRAIFEAACHCARAGVKVHPKIMIPLVAHSNELKIEADLLEAEAKRVMTEQGTQVKYQFGTMIEIPRAALTADQIAERAQFFSFGTNDLTQTTFGISRDDAEAGFLMEYLQKGILSKNPFATIDERGVGQLMQLGVALGRRTRPSLEVGICGEHGGDPESIAFCHRAGLNYVSCSPLRVPIARLAAAHAALDAISIKD